MTFQMIVLWTAVLIFLATLGFIGYSIYTSQYNVAWPPSVSDCPDYWNSDGTTCTIGASKYNKCSATSFKIVPNLCDKFTQSQACIKNNPSFNWSGVSNSLTCKST
jgi:hypothetical protein